MARKIFSNNRDRFISLAESRTNKIINDLRVLSHCSNKSLYEYNEVEIEKIFKAIEEEVFKTRLKFKEKDKAKFKL